MMLLFAYNSVKSVEGGGVDKGLDFGVGRAVGVHLVGGGGGGRVGGRRGAIGLDSRRVGSRSRGVVGRRVRGRSGRVMAGGRVGGGSWGVGRGSRGIGGGGRGIGRGGRGVGSSVHQLGAVVNRGRVQGSRVVDRGVVRGGVAVVIFLPGVQVQLGDRDGVARHQGVAKI